MINVVDHTYCSRSALFEDTIDPLLIGALRERDLVPRWNNPRPLPQHNGSVSVRHHRHRGFG
jgi:hypothetical protein